MSYQFPEAPILLYPTLAKQVGVEAAVLLTLYQQQLQRLPSAGSGRASELVMSREQWLELGQFWDEEQLAQLTSQLVALECIDAAFSHDGRVTVRWLHQAEPETIVEEVEEIEIVSRLPVVESVPVSPPVPEYHQQPSQQYPSSQDTPYYPDEPLNQPAEQPAANTGGIVNRGPAPTFGGSIGWARKARQMNAGQSDELQAKFMQQEQLKKQLQSMNLGWQPSQNFYALLPRHNISVEFAQSCLDEFVLYWLDKDRKETNWDQKFLGWVKREWVKKQTQDGRQQRINSEQQTGFNHENTRRDSRENRKRVTAAIMDIKDTDW